ncbi:MAG: hypothetical protein ACLS5G_00555 [Streptococcus sp.]
MLVTGRNLMRMMTPKEKLLSLKMVLFLQILMIQILIAKPLREYLVNKSGKVDNDKVQKEFDKIQKSLKSHGYQAKSVNDIYHDERSSYYLQL